MDVPIEEDRPQNSSPSEQVTGSTSSQTKIPAEHSICHTASETSMETIKFVHKWRIDQFSIQQELASVGESLESSPFGTESGSYRFRLKLFPCGKDEECRGYLSLFLQIHRCPSAKVRFRVNFYIETTEGPRGCALNRNVVIINKNGIVTASKFFSMETLKQRANRFLPDDMLTVGTELTVFGEQVSREVEVPRPMPDAAAELQAPPDPGSLSYDLAKLFENMPDTDCVLRVEEGKREFRAHRVILCARSPVFAAMFSHSNTIESRNSAVDVGDVTANAMESMLEFMYTDKCTKLEERALEILAGADKYCLEQLKDMCERYLCKDLAPENVCERLRFADAYSAYALRRESLVIVEKNRNTVLVSPDWTELETECPLLAAHVLKEVMTNTMTPVSATGSYHKSQSQSLLSANPQLLAKSRSISTTTTPTVSPNSSQTITSSSSQTSTTPVAYTVNALGQMVPKKTVWPRATFNGAAAGSSSMSKQQARPSPVVPKREGSASPPMLNSTSARETSPRSEQSSPPSKRLKKS